jgi:hypothetical protein
MFIVLIIPPDFNIQIGYDIIKRTAPATSRPLRGKNRIFFFKHLIYYAILSSFKGGRHGYSTEGTSVG